MCPFSTIKTLFFFFNSIYLFGCVGSPLLHVDFLWLRRTGATLRCGARVSHCSGFSCCRAHALGVRASVVWHTGSVVMACGLSSYGARA